MTSGYGDPQARQIFRDLVAIPATITVTDTEVEVSFHRRSHLPIVLASGLMDYPWPSLGGAAADSASRRTMARSKPRRLRQMVVRGN
jgi:hypothetical protein